MLALCPGLGGVRFALADDGPARRQEDGSQPSVMVSIVGDSLSTTELSDIMGRSPKYDYAFESVVHFVPDDWYRASDDAEADIRVWIVMDQGGTTTLYFAHPGSDRFLIRHLRLSNQMDEMDKESLSQALSWSLAALSQGTVDALTRKQATALVSDSGVLSATPLRPDKAGHRGSLAPPRDDNAESRPADTAFEPRTEGRFLDLATGYRTTLFSEEIPLVHAPYLRLGLDYLVSGVQLGIGALGAYELPSTYREDGVELRLSSFYLRFELRALLLNRSGRVGFGPVLGAGVQTTFASPRVEAESRLVASDSSSIEAGFIAFGLLGQVHFSRVVRGELGVDVDFDFRTMRYTIVQDGVEQLFVNKLVVRPALRAGLSFF